MNQCDHDDYSHCATCCNEAFAEREKELAALAKRFETAVEQMTGAIAVLGNERDTLRRRYFELDRENAALRKKLQDFTSG